MATERGTKAYRRWHAVQLTNRDGIVIVTTDAKAQMITFELIHDDRRKRDDRIELSLWKFKDVLETLKL